MNIGDVAATLDMPASTIRYYEKIGLIDRQTRVSGRRVFDDRAVFVLEFIRLALAAGFSIAETKSLLQAYAKDSSPADVWGPLAAGKRAWVRKQIRELRQMDRILEAMVSCECASLADCVEKGLERRGGR